MLFNADTVSQEFVLRSHRIRGEAIGATIGFY